MSAVCAANQLELVNQLAGHVVNFCSNLAFCLAENDVHFAVVGVGNNVDLHRGLLFVEAEESANEPESALNARAGFAMAVNRGVQPNGVFYAAVH